MMESVGEPFWVLMRVDTEGRVTGEYFANRANELELVPLFPSKEDAIDALRDLKAADFVVRGLNQRQLYALLKLSADLRPDCRFLVMVPNERRGLPMTPAEAIKRFVDPSILAEQPKTH